MYVGQFYHQEVNGRLYYVTPILHDGLFSYNRNRAGTPGFIMVFGTHFSVGSIIGIGTTIREAEQSYRINLNRLGGGQLATPDVDILTIEGYIIRWGQHTISGDTLYTFIIEGHEDRLLTVDPSHSQATVTQQGDRVRIQVMATDAYRWSVSMFENLGFEFARDAYVD